MKLSHPLATFPVLLALGSADLACQQDLVPVPAAQIVNGRYHRIQAVVDLDLDGDLDYIGSDEGSPAPHVAWMRNRGDGATDQAARLWQEGTTIYYDFAVLDLDGDGANDALVFDGKQMVLVHSTKTGPSITVGPSTTMAGTVHVGDVDGDGRDDATLQSRSTIKTFGFASGITELVSDFSPQTLVCVTDANGDNKAEIWTATDGWLFVYQVENGNLHSPTLHTNPFKSTVHALPGDVDGDGDLDVALFEENGGRTPGRYAVLRRTSPSTFSLESVLTGGPATHLADLDGDGAAEGVCCGGGSGPFPNESASTFMVSPNDGTGGFAPSFPIRGMGALRLAAAADVDGDGDRDLVAGRCVVFHPGQLDAMRQAWAFGEPLDMDGDGDLDASSGSPTSYRGLGDGTFVYELGGPPGGATGVGLLADYDGDGAPDWIAEVGSPGSTQVRIYNSVAGHFFYWRPAAAPGVSFRQTSPHQSGGPTTWRNHTALSADWDGDGDLDAIVVDETAGWSRLWRNNGFGFFTAGPVLPANDVVVGVAELTGDGVVDLVVGLAGNRDGLWLRPGNGTGFDAAVLVSSGPRDHRPGIVDLDGDGDKDLFVSTDAGGALLRNDGSGGFTTEPHDFLAREFATWTFTDLDGDQRLDVIAHEAYRQNGYASSITLQLPGGGFDAAASVIGRLTGVGDADADGDADLFGDTVMLSRSPVGNGVGSSVQYGNSVFGFGGVLPRISSVGRLLPGNPFELRLSGARGGANGALVLGTDRTFGPNTPLPGLTLLVLPVAVVPVVATGAVGNPGAGGVSFFGAVPGGIPGATVNAQAFFLDASAPSGATQTNGVEITFVQ